MFVTLCRIVTYCLPYCKRWQMPRASGKCLALLLLGETICLPGPEKLWIRKNSDKWSTKMQLVCVYSAHRYVLLSMILISLRKCIFASSRLKKRLKAFLHSSSYFKKVVGKPWDLLHDGTNMAFFSCAFLCMSLLDRDVRLVSTQGSSPKGPTSSRKSRLVFVFH